MKSQLRFAHVADLHLGAWREKTLKELNFTTFQKTIELIIKEKYDFCLFAGDLFNNPLPPLELVERVVEELLKLKSAGIPLYVIGGSHDYSSQQKSFLSLLSKTGVFEDVCNFSYVDKNSIQLHPTINEDLGILVCGVLGKKNGLDKHLYSNLAQITSNKEYISLFMFHTTLDDIKPAFMEKVHSQITSKMLPEGFDYYAGGHIHTHIESRYSGSALSYPGPLFPNSFRELLQERPMFNEVLIERESKEVSITQKFINSYDLKHLHIVLEKELYPSELYALLIDEVDKVSCAGKLVLLEVEGELKGPVSDVGFSKIVECLYQKSALHVLKHLSSLKYLQEEIEEFSQYDTIEEIEREIIAKYEEDEVSAKKIKSLYGVNLEKKDGETIAQFEQKILELTSKLF